MKVGKLMVPRGEDGPIWGTRLRRDGWRKAETDVFDLANPVAPRYTLRMTVYEVGARRGPWYSIGYTVLDEHERSATELGLSDWADWDHNGDLLLATDGKLMRGRLGEFANPALVADLRDMKFRQRAAPPEMQRWGPRSRRITRAFS
jgi:hypothetical protein